MATKKPSKTEIETELARAHALLKKQNEAGIMIASLAATEYFGPAAARDPDVVLALFEELDWDDAGDPEEDISEMLDKDDLADAARIAKEQFGDEIGSRPIVILKIYLKLVDEFEEE